MLYNIFIHNLCRKIGYGSNNMAISISINQDHLDQSRKRSTLRLPALHSPLAVDAVAAAPQRARIDFGFTS